MARIEQLTKKPRKKRRYKDKRPALKKCPQKSATCLRVFTTTPRKPNSALRKVAWVLFSNFKKSHVYIPGIGHTLQKHNKVLVQGGRVADVPGMKYTMIRGKMDLKPLYLRRQRRSLYASTKIYSKIDCRYRKYYYW